MRDRMNRMLIGFGLMFGLQFVVAWLAKSFFGMAGDANIIIGIPLVITVAVYFGGGLIMGLLSERLNLLEPLAIALLAVALNMACYAVGAAPDLTFMSVALKSGSPVLPLAINLGSVVLASMAGAFLGARLNAHAEDWFSRAATLAGFFSLIFGPFLLLMVSGRDAGRPGLPWYVMVIVGLLFVIVAGIGYALFARKKDDISEISISPDYRRDLR